MNVHGQESSTAQSLREGWLPLAAWILLCLAVGWIGASSTESGQSAWFRALEKPPWNPPTWLFAPVWTVLYVLMGIAAWLVSRHPPVPGKAQAQVLFMTQLALNFAWTFIFFGAHRIGLALLDIALLLGLIAATLIGFRRIDRRAGWLMVPYLCWVTFATALNFSIWQSN